MWHYDIPSGMWTWITGPATTDSIGDYRSRLYSPLNQPPARMGAVQWTDSSGNLWMFGGKGVQGYYNDIWSFNGQDWAWKGGPNTPSQPGNYNSIGVADSSGLPYSRESSLWCTNANGMPWLYGGQSTTPPGRVGDLWTVQSPQMYMVLEFGNATGRIPPSYGARGEPGEGNTPGSRTRGAAWCDSLGNFWLFGGEDFNVGELVCCLLRD